jgi:arginine/lysine/ornithine decarboxylase
MPGHKGQAFLGIEPLDITEIDGADSLYEADGIIRQSEDNASALFGCPTYYSTEGSSQCIRAMVYLAALHAKARGRKPLIAAARNAHKTFLSAVALLDLEVLWLYPEQNDSYLTCRISPEALEQFLCSAAEKPTAVYLTSPDYLGTLADIAGLSAVCRRHGVLLLVDNAHGAYLHLSPQLQSEVGAQVKTGLELFGSTSPSYLILQSLDRANPYLEQYGQRLQEFLPHVGALKAALAQNGYRLLSEEPLKITVSAKEYGYTGKELADYLQQHRMVCEFADPDYLVLMVTPETGAEGLERLKDVLLALPQKQPLSPCPLEFHSGEQVLSIRQAMLSPGVVLPVEQCEGRILASASVGCPPAVPILICGERINAHAIDCFRYYGIQSVTVL